MNQIEIDPNRLHPQEVPISNTNAQDLSTFSYSYAAHSREPVNNAH